MGTLARPVLFLLVAASVAICPMQISTGEELMEVKLDLQVLLKLGVSAMAGLLGIWGFLTSPNVRRLLLSLPSCAIILILVFGIPAGLSGVSQSALPSLMINFAYLLLIATAMSYLGSNGFVIAVMLGSIAVCVASWVLYIGFPEYGVFVEDLGSVTVTRMSGISHPNSVGRSAAVAMLAILVVRQVKLITLPTAVVFFALAAMTLAFTVSRTSIVAFLVGAAVLHLDKVRSRMGIQLIAVGATLLIATVFFLLVSGSESALAEKFVGSVAKTGDAEELTSGTGRAEIWAESIRLIRERPLTGYGIGSAQTLLEEFSQSTHNMFLHAAMISGVAGLLLMGTLAFRLCRLVFVGRYRGVSAFASMILVSGLLEDTVFETFPGPGTLVFFFCCLHAIYLSADAEQDVAVLSESEFAPA